MIKKKIKRFLPTDWQDAQRMFIVVVGSSFFFYQIFGGDIERLVNKLEKAGLSAAMIWAVFIQEPPRSRGEEP